MRFKYQAKNKEGEDQVGYVDAGTRDSAISMLTGHDLFVLSLQSADDITWYDRILNYFKAVKRQDIVILTRQLATLLEARLSLNKALLTLREETTNPILKEAVFQISQDVDAGLAFSQAVERQPKVFSEFFVSMIRSAEVTGNLDQVMTFLADYIEREALLVTKTRSALIYPGIIIGLFAVVAFILVAFVFPQIKPVFDEAGVVLPLFSELLINFGIIIGRWWFLVVLGMVILGILAFDYIDTSEGRAFMDDVKIRTPFLNRVYLPITITRFANASAMLIKGGVPVAQAMEIVAVTVDNVLYQDILHEVSQAIREGQPLSESIAKHPAYFPPLVSQMIAVGETTGRLDQIFERIAGFYGKESDTVISNLVDLVQPVLMIAVGLMVGVLFASLLLPLYQLTSAIK